MDAINGDGSELWQYFNIFFIYLTATKKNFITLMLLIAFTIFKKAQINEVIKIKISLIYAYKTKNKKSFWLFVDLLFDKTDS